MRSEPKDLWKGEMFICKNESQGAAQENVAANYDIFRGELGCRDSRRR